MFMMMCFGQSGRISGGVIKVLRRPARSRVLVPCDDRHAHRRCCLQSGSFGWPCEMSGSASTSLTKTRTIFVYLGGHEGSDEIPAASRGHGSAHPDQRARTGGQHCAGHGVIRIWSTRASKVSWARSFHAVLAQSGPARKRCPACSRWCLVFCKGSYLEKRRERVEWTMIVTRNRSCCSGSLARDHSPRVRI